MPKEIQLGPHALWAYDVVRLQIATSGGRSAVVGQKHLVAQPTSRRVRQDGIDTQPSLSTPRCDAVRAHVRLLIQRMCLCLHVGFSLSLPSSTEDAAFRLLYPSPPPQRGSITGERTPEREPPCDDGRPAIHVRPGQSRSVVRQIRLRPQGRHPRKLGSETRAQEEEAGWPAGDL
jgi:hypothetical protein